MNPAAIQQLLAGVILFTSIVLLLVMLVLLVRRLLLPGSEVMLDVNGIRRMKADTGNNVLSALSENGIFLPAACGGRGSCGQCRIKVLGGRGVLTPVEGSHIKRIDAALGYRLACMCMLKQDLQIQIPDALLDVRQWRCTVYSSRCITTFMKELVLHQPPGETLTFSAGDYVLVEAPPHQLRFADFAIEPEYRDEWQRYDLFSLESDQKQTASRAYSMANYPGEGSIIILTVRIALPPTDAPRGTPPGHVSSWLFSLKPGDEVLVSGPFGDFHAQQSGNEMVMIGGGAGIAPMRSIIKDQLIRQKTNRKISFWYGARNLRELCYKDEFDQLAEDHNNFSWQAALSEPLKNTTWQGATGFIHSLVYQQYLKNHPAPETLEYYICGPPLMNVAVLQMLEDLGVDQDNIFLDAFEASP